MSSGLGVGRDVVQGKMAVEGKLSLDVLKITTIHKFCSKWIYGYSIIWVNISCFNSSL